MENFKSFGRKLTVPFFPGFTAITGPNGSGKSNIVDAILFVLGPKSSKVMRAGRLTDLIFNGGKKQKNPAKYCKVSLVFDNEDRKLPLDEDTVILTRMIKRAPLKSDPDNYYSYYYINNKSASLSGFIDLLSHARITGDGYNIVKQGDITDIVKMGPVERRRIIEDVAGISTYDSDLKKADLEKKEVEHNMERISIILNEINAQLRNLKRERDEAYRYKELQEDSYRIKSQIATKKLNEMQSQIAELHSQIRTYRTDQQKQTQSKKELSSNLQTVNEQLNKVEQQIADSGGEEATELKNQIDTLRAEVVKSEEQARYLGTQQRDIKSEIHSFESQIHSIDSTLQQYFSDQEKFSSNLTQEKENLDSLQQNYQTLKDQLDSQDSSTQKISEQLLTMRESYNEAQSELHELNLKSDRINDSLNALSLTKNELSSSKEHYTTEIADIDFLLKDLRAQTKDTQKILGEKEKELFSKKKLESDLTAQLSDLSKTIYRLQRESSKLQAELDALAQVSNKYNPAVNALLSARDNKDLSGIHGTIAELANVEENYATALSIAAGARMQSIVVEDDAAAAQAITYLKDHRLGRATFLPLNKMYVGKPRAKPLLAVKDEAALGFALDLVDYSEQYSSAFWYVFGDTVIVESLSDARRLMGGVRLVDLKGNLIEASGAIIGGSIPKTKLGFGNMDRSKLDSISLELSTVTAHQDEVSEKINAVREEIVAIEESIRQIRNGPELSTRISDLSLQKKNYQTKLTAVSDQLNTILDEHKSLTADNEEIHGLIDQASEKIKSLEEKKNALGRQLVSSTSQQTAQQLKALEDDITSKTQNILRLESELETLTKKIDIEQGRKNDISKKISQEQDDLLEISEKLSTLEQKKNLQREKLDSLMHVQSQQSGQLKELSGKRDSLYKESVDLSQQFDSVSTKIESYSDLIQRAEFRLPTLEEAAGELRAELDVYKVTVNSDVPLPSLSSLKEDLSRVQQTMVELEPVNMRALEEYDHQAKRKEAFEGDIKRLRKQKRNLESLVSDITEKKQERFYTAFHEINGNFKQIYSNMSEGGEAELLLENPESVFEGGLSIKARPRGKKILRLNALSGGEKSMASLGFIFSLQRYDPSPFYVLDEVDMFLDGVNAETISRILRMNSEQTQFINVSLRKVVLSGANHIYGVTMLDTGVSELIGNLHADNVGPKGQLLTSRRSR